MYVQLVEDVVRLKMALRLLMGPHNQWLPALLSGAVKHARNKVEAENA